MELFEAKPRGMPISAIREDIFAYGQKEPIEVAGTFTTEIVCEANGETCVDEFTVIKGDGRPLLGKRTAE